MTDADVQRVTPPAIVKSADATSRLTELPNLALIQGVDLATLKAVELDLTTGGNESTARELLIAAIASKAVEGNGHVEGANGYYFFDDLKEPQEGPDGIVKARVTEAEFQMLQTEVGPEFAKKVRYDSRDLASHQMLKYLQGKGQMMDFRFSYNAPKQEGVDKKESGAALAERFAKKPGRKALRK